MPRYTRAEQETIIRFDEEDRTLDIYTASARVARQLQRRGYPMLPLTNPSHGWRARGISPTALTFRRQGPDCSETPKRELTPEHRARLAAALQTARVTPAPDTEEREVGRRDYSK
jgi:hypothetical protein